MKVKNSNFYPVMVSIMNVSLMYYENEVGLKSYPKFTVKSRGSQQVRDWELLLTSGSLTFVCLGQRKTSCQVYFTTG